MSSHAVGHTRRVVGEHLLNQTNVRVLDATSSVEVARLELAQCLNEAARITGVDLDACERLSRQISGMTFNLVVAGQFKRGKSTVINALLGDALLPTGVVPLTSIVTVVRYGPKLVVSVHGEDGSERTIPVSELQSYVTERGNPDNRKRIRQVFIEHPSRWLAHGVQLVDTPGIGSVYQHNTDVAQRFLPQADAVLFIASVDQPLGSAELDFLSHIRQYAGRIFCILNKTDYLEPNELVESVAFATDRIRATLDATAPLFAVSAKLALQSKRDGTSEALARSGFPALEGSLDEFMAREKNAVWVSSVARRLLRILSELRFTLQLETKLLSAPVEQIEGNLAAFTGKRTQVQRAATDHQVLLEADARSVVRNDIEPALAEFKEKLKTLMSGGIENWYAELKALRSSALQEALEARLTTEIRDAYDGWIAKEDARLRIQFDSLCSRAWSNLQSAVDELMRYSSELFSVDFAPIRTDAHWSLESGFYYKFWYEPPSLKILATSATFALPKRLAARIIINRLHKRALELIEVQAGRIRHDFEERMKASVRAAHRQLAENATSILERIETAISNGLSVRRQSEAYTEARRADLTDLTHRTLSIESRVNALLS